MAYAYCMDIGNRPQHLVWVELHNEAWNDLLHFEVLLHHFVDCIGDKVHHNVQIYLIWFVTVSVEVLPHLYTVRMVQHFQNLQFSILIPLVLEDLLYCHCFSSFSYNSFKDNPKGAISNDLLSIISKTLLLLVLMIEDLINTDFAYGF